VVAAVAAEAAAAQQAKSRPEVAAPSGGGVGSATGGDNSGLLLRLRAEQVRQTLPRLLLRTRWPGWPGWYHWASSSRVVGDALRVAVAEILGRCLVPPFWFPLLSNSHAPF
jgi:hypothetical protein